ncbi:hypothetical protein DICPUDRAFT_95934 [Dictyostelium purpureum]|uniref:MIT domain-containing protein n=1 Tax=Dictyostelium purpureum TaxID=5786 RepID=F1A2S9_DICPU|nr:uncharacterized protein DICPUDRAFT_95934 [Dictyostelium purpureum]EGC29500.1 hypothetical protein DICPUDRAFT_95934 [Dictyostelium purpureum]|eukprot:XP_003293975.1 hypothetical protein DICPUDRAFT_95934 [Dictyostelium purpureum]
MSVSLQSALELVHKAVSLDNSGKAQEAISMYSIAIEQLKQASQTTYDQNTKNLIESKILEYQNRSSFLKSSLHLDYNNNTVSNFPSPPQNNNNINNNNNNGSGNLLDQALKFANEAIGCESSNNIQGAIVNYKKCVELLEQVSRDESNIETRLFLNQKRQEYQGRCESLELTISNSNGFGNSGSLNSTMTLMNNNSNNNLNSINSKTRSQFLKNKIQYNQNKVNNEYDSIPLSLKPGQKYKDPVRKKNVLERLSKSIKGPKNISDHWL